MDYNKTILENFRLNFSRDPLLRVNYQVNVQPCKPLGNPITVSIIKS